MNIDETIARLQALRPYVLPQVEIVHAIDYIGPVFNPISFETIDSTNVEHLKADLETVREDLYFYIDHALELERINNKLRGLLDECTAKMSEDERMEIKHRTPS